MILNTTIGDLYRDNFRTKAYIELVGYCLQDSYDLEKSSKIDAIIEDNIYIKKAKDKIIEESKRNMGLCSNPKNFLKYISLFGNEILNILREAELDEEKYVLDIIKIGELDKKYKIPN